MTHADIFVFAWGLNCACLKWWVKFFHPIDNFHS
jgi:hypothetical protein